jgi:hypothetical protein
MKSILTDELFWKIFSDYKKGIDFSLSSGLVCLCEALRLCVFA